MPNEGHIILPLATHIRLQAMWDEYDKSHQVVRRPAHRNREMRGRVWEIRNEAVWDAKTQKYLSLLPLQVACAALPQARDRGVDVIRVKTPVRADDPGAKVAGSIDFSVAWLAKTMREDEGFYPSVIDGKIRMEDEAVNTMPQTWQFNTDGAAFIPSV